MAASFEDLEPLNNLKEFIQEFGIDIKHSCIVIKFISLKKP